MINGEFTDFYLFCKGRERTLKTVRLRRRTVSITYRKPRFSYISPIGLAIYHSQRGIQHVI